MDCSILKLDDERRLVYGLAMVSRDAAGQLVTDLQGDQIEERVLEDAFHDYVTESRQGDHMHDRRKGVASLVECFVVTPEKLAGLLKALGVDADVSAYKGAAAFVGYQVHDAETWAEVKAGKLKAFSIDGSAERVAA